MMRRADSATGYRLAAMATLSAAVAGITLLSGLLQLRVSALSMLPGISLQPIPSRSWPNIWLDSALTAQQLQQAALLEWLRLVVVLLLIVLIISAVSALVALFAHASARRYEIALAAVVGASRAQLTQVQLRNAGLNAVFALAVGVPAGLLAAWAAHESWPQLQHAMTPLPWIMLATLGTALLAAAVAFATARRMAHAGWLGDVLAPEARSNPGYGGEDLRSVLLHLQFAFTFALVVVALLIRSHDSPQQSPLARDQAAFLTRLTWPPPAQGQTRDKWVRGLDAQGYAVSSPGVLLGMGESDQVLVDCGRCSFANMPLPFFPLRTQMHVIGSSFFARAGHPLSAGREFTPADAQDRNIIVNDTFALLAFQGQPALGKTLQVGGLDGEWYRVIGVVRDVPASGLQRQQVDVRTVVKVRDRAPGREAAIYFYALEKPPALLDVISSAPLNNDSRSFRGVLQAARAPVRWFGGLLATLASAAALIAALSLGAITLLNVRQRQPEIAARRAVGARRRDIAKLVLVNTLAMALRSLAGGVVLSIAFARGVQLMLPGLQLFDAPMLLLTAVGLTGIAMVAALWPARAATLVAPGLHH